MGLAFSTILARPAPRLSERHPKGGRIWLYAQPEWLSPHVFCAEP